MIPRYSLPEMEAVWSPERRLAAWQEVETLALEAWAELGVVPAQAARAVRERGRVDPEAVEARERITRHDVAAFVEVLASSVGEGGDWVHYGLTSSDVVDTAQAVLLREAADLLLGKTAALFEAVRRRALRHRETVMIGRTHGAWAEPTTFGLKLAGWAFEVARAHRRLAEVRTTVAVGKVSGAVGTYAHVPPDVERYVCERLGLGVEPASTQVVPRDRHAEFLQAIALTGASLERFATEIRLLQRTEVGEVYEPFGSGQKGSSAMPHKRNPVLSERVCGLARLLRSYAQAGLEDVALWHERDISHSSVERVVLPDACLVLDFALHSFTRVVREMEVREDRMRENLEATGGVVFSQAVLLALVEAGMGRDEAYRVVQRNALQAHEEGSHLRDLLRTDPEVPLEEGALGACFDPHRLLRHTGVVFDRLEDLRLDA